MSQIPSTAAEVLQRMPRITEGLQAVIANQIKEGGISLPDFIDTGYGEYAEYRIIETWARNQQDHTHNKLRVAMDAAHKLTETIT